MKLFIKHMVSARCTSAVENELNNLGISFASVGLGEADVTDFISLQVSAELKISLSKLGLVLMDKLRWIEFVVAVALIASPLVLQFYAPPTYLLASYFFSGVEVVVLVTWFATDYSVEH